MVSYCNIISVPGRGAKATATGHRPRPLLSAPKWNRRDPKCTQRDPK